jgi:hypothetical protein
MKLLNCISCNDVIALTGTVRYCLCRSSCGKYLPNQLEVVIAGSSARVLGILNNEYEASKQIDVVPFVTSYRWFPIRSEPNHHVRIVEMNELAAVTDDVFAFAVQCLHCTNVIISRTRQDFNECMCTQVKIDGCSVLTSINDHCSARILGDPAAYLSYKIKLKPGITKRALYEDWDFNQNQFKSLLLNQFVVISV